ncbi:hypothetical protein CJU89_6103 [Yarrowia sp. B02]|nr:hypothetical protein CJU89_6103 [Yarrowia sp. B02]
MDPVEDSDELPQDAIFTSKHGITVDLSETWLKDRLLQNTHMLTKVVSLPDLLVILWIVEEEARSSALLKLKNSKGLLPDAFRRLFYIDTLPCLYLMGSHVFLIYQEKYTFTDGDGFDEYMSNWYLVYLNANKPGALMQIPGKHPKSLVCYDGLFMHLVDRQTIQTTQASLGAAKPVSEETKCSLPQEGYASFGSDRPEHVIDLETCQSAVLRCDL